MIDLVIILPILLRRLVEGLDLGFKQPTLCPCQFLSLGKTIGTVKIPRALGSPSLTAVCCVLAACTSSSLEGTGVPPQPARKLPRKCPGDPQPQPMSKSRESICFPILPWGLSGKYPGGPGLKSTPYLGPEILKRKKGRKGRREGGQVHV